MNELLTVEKSWSPALKTAIEFAWLNYGKLRLQDGNVWSHNYGTKPLYITPEMVDNMVAAGLAVYSTFRWKGRRRFPVEVEITILKPLPPGVTMTTHSAGVCYFGPDGKVLLEHPIDCPSARRVVANATHDMASEAASRNY